MGGEGDGGRDGGEDKEVEEEEERFVESLMRMFCGGKVPAMRCGGAVICQQGQGCGRVIACDGVSQLQAVRPDSQKYRELPRHCRGTCRMRKVK